MMPVPSSKLKKSVPTIDPQGPKSPIIPARKKQITTDFQKRGENAGGRIIE